MSLIKTAGTLRTAEALTRISLARSTSRCGQTPIAYRSAHCRARKLAMTTGGPNASDIEADRRAVERFRKLVPALGGNFKGMHGKVAVVGGCLEFSGAPFFAAMSALRVGADMAYVICTPSASTAIKSYSPELMVLPYLPEQPQGAEEGPVDQAAVDRAVRRISPWLSRATTVVVGPGLGADPAVCAAAAALMGEVRRMQLPLVVDGSALTHVVAKQPDTVVGYRSCVLTPNVAELGRIAGSVGLPLPGRMSDAWLGHAPRIAEAFKGPVLVAKGEVDLICTDTTDSQKSTDQALTAPLTSSAPAPGGAAAGLVSEGESRGPLLRCCDPGSLRRCGGQGDVLAGTAAAFLGWAVKHSVRTDSPPAANCASRHPAAAAQQTPPSASMPPPSTPPHRSDAATAAATRNSGGGDLDTDTVALCAYVACKVMRGAARVAYGVGERSMVAGDIIPLLYPTFKAVVGSS